MHEVKQSCVCSLHGSFAGPLFQNWLNASKSLSSHGNWILNFFCMYDFHTTFATAVGKSSVHAGGQILPGAAAGIEESAHNHLQRT